VTGWHGCLDDIDPTGDTATGQQGGYIVKKTLLVPLDGSEESEASLPWATKLAQERDLTLTLARVAQYPNYAAGPEESMSVEVYQQVLEVEEEEANSYLDRVGKQLAETGLQVETIMRDGRPSFTLLDLADELSASAIVIASHGRGGVKRVVLGSVARTLVSHASIPVFLVRAATPEHRREPALDRLLIPLDGSVLAESALDVAREVVAAGSTLVLVRVADTSAQGVPLATAYLDRVAANLRAAGVAVETQVIVGESKSAVSGQLAEAAAASNADAIVMVTHGRGGVSGWFLGSVANEVVQIVDRPVLLVSARAVGARATGQQHVRDVMTGDVMTLQEDESLVVALRKLVRRRASGAPVLDAKGSLVGVISQRDIMSWHEHAVKELAKHSLLVPGEYLRRLQTERVRTVMTSSPTTIPESASLQEAMALFRERKIHRLPVTRNGRLVGIITGSDILLTMLAQIESVVEGSRPEELLSSAELLASVVGED
jgi:nucleotide-binding universal stress UspA family protein/predicted transcriptional regulator